MMKLNPEQKRAIHRGVGIGLWVGAALSIILALYIIGQQPAPFQGRMLLVATILVAVEAVLGHFFFSGKFLGAKQAPPDSGPTPPG